jgi:hypothetical protein
MRKTISLLLLSLIILSLNAKSYYIENLSVNAELTSTGTLMVEENWTYVLEGGPFTRIFREIPDDFCDGIVPGEILQDGNFLNPHNPHECKISVDEGVTMTVFFPNLYDRTTTVTWKYSILNPFEIVGNDLQFKWMPVPFKYDFLIKQGEISLKKPTTDEAVDILRPIPINVEFEETESQLIYRFKNFKGEHFLVGYRAPAEDFYVKQPQFIRIRQAQEKYYTLNVIVGLISLFILIIVIIASISSTVRKRRKADYFSLELPNETHPILVWKLLYSPNSKGYNYGGAVLNLIWKGAIIVDGKAKSAFSKDYDWHFNENYAVDTDIDRTLLEELKTIAEKKKKPLIATAKLLLQIRKNPLGKQLHDTFFQENLGDEIKTKKVMSHLVISVIFLIVCSLLTIPAVILWESGVGYAFIPVIILFLISFCVLLFNGTKRTLTETGEVDRANWIGFKKFYLENLKKNEVIMDENYLKKVFPYLVIFGIEKKFLKYCTANNLDIPEFFKELNFTNWHDFASFNAGFVAVIAASGSGATGGGGAGAAGGGGAGAA